MHLASARDARGRGVGAQLHGAVFDRARRNGYRVCQLDVASDNPAVRFYERMGMEILSESRVRPLQKHGVANHYRIIKTLDAPYIGEGAVMHSDPWEQYS